MFSSVKLFLSDPVLAWLLYFGPATPSQYRLTGPGAWCEARQNILTIQDRLAAPGKTRKVVRGNWRQVRLLVHLSVLIFFIVLIFGCLLLQIPTVIF